MDTYKTLGLGSNPCASPLEMGSRLDVLMLEMGSRLEVLILEMGSRPYYPIVGTTSIQDATGFEASSW